MWSLEGFGNRDLPLELNLPSPWQGRAARAAHHSFVLGCALCVHSSEGPEQHGMGKVPPNPEPARFTQEQTKLGIIFGQSQVSNL